MSKTKQEILIVGDTHAYWTDVNKLLEHYKPEIMIVLGDFGFWPKFSRYDINKLNVGNTLIYFIDGNHDDHWSLRDRTSNKIAPNIIYVPRGDVLTFNKTNILFMGGADSIDKQVRIEGVDWFREEVISQLDFQNIPPDDTKIDVVLSHTCPTSILRKIDEINPLAGKEEDPSCDALEKIFDIFRPRLWLFGHFHHRYHFAWKGCDFHGLDMIYPYENEGPRFESAVYKLEV